MATVFLAINGDGLGHLVRATIACRALQSAGERPVIFSQGRFALGDLSHFPGKQVPSLWKATHAVRRLVASELRSMAEISLPAIVIEDTHPNPVSLPPGIRRVLLVRPTSFQYLLQLKAQYGSIYSVFLLCDSPDSPTWPYSRAETAAVLGWDNWHVVGPFYRSAAEADILEVRRRYGITAEQRLFVFSMGGGGGHESHPDGRDAERFVARASEIAAQLQRHDRAVRLIFVQGPYFPATVGLGPPFEIVPHEPLMPALLATADAAFIRAGFNTTWECIAGTTPFLPFIGTTSGEPVPERLQGMEAHGLLAENIETLWLDENWRERFRLSCQRIVNQYPGKPEPSRFRQLILPRSAGNATGQRKERRPTATSNRPRLLPPLPLTIRIDDVVSPEPALSWLLEILAGRGLRASMEVVPYLLEFDEGYVETFDRAGTLFEISQHGYAHVPRSVNGRGRFEFSPASRQPSDDEIASISWGKTRLEQVFRQRFTGGFSPPFDALPPWLPSLWRDQGGKFLSYSFIGNVNGSPLPVARAGIEVWDWSRNRGLDGHNMRRQLVRHAALYGHVGIVLHTRCLRRQREQARFIRLLDLLQRCGVASLSLREVATGENTSPRGHAIFGNYLWALAAWSSGRL